MKPLTRVTDLTQDTSNANAGTERGRQMVADSLRRYGAGRSVLADKNGKLIAGNKTADAAVAAGMAIRTVQTSGDELIVVQRTDLDLDTDTGARALAYADNRVAEVGLSWDAEQIMADLDAFIDLDEMFTPDELAALTSKLDRAVVVAEPGGDPDTLPELPSTTLTQPGDIIILGRHRLICGSSADPEVIARLTGGQPIGAVLTDPPYNLGLEYHPYDATQPTDEFWQLLAGAFANGMALLKRPGHFVLTFSQNGIPDMIPFCKDLGLEYRHLAFWHNPQRKAGSYPGMWGYAYEPIFDFTLGGWRKLNNGNGVGGGDVWIENSPITTRAGNEDYHPAQKPSGVWTDLVNLISNPGEAVLDLFGGSGTTVIACETAGRRARVCEVDPRYCDLIVRRWEQFTGKEARREQRG